MKIIENSIGIKLNMKKKSKSKFFSRINFDVEDAELAQREAHHHLYHHLRHYDGGEDSGGPAVKHLHHFRFYLNIGKVRKGVKTHLMVKCEE